MKRNKFNLSNDHDLTMDMGYLVPINVEEVVPGDVFQGRSMALIRLNGVLRPVMTPIIARIHHWFVPYRKIWDDWEEFISGFDEDAVASTKTHPYIAISADPGEGSLLDYLGVPPGTYGTTINVNALFVRAYIAIYNHAYRDEQLQPALTIDKTDGADTTTVTALQRVNWSKDRFVAARSQPQLGSDITIPLSGNAPITGFGSTNVNPVGTPANARETDQTTVTPYADHWTGNTWYMEEDPSNANYPNIRANLAAASGVDINELRLAIKLQEIKERRNIYGTGYMEFLLSEYGVKSSDARLQNPEFLGGGRNIVNFSEIASTDGANTGDLKGHGIGALRSNRFRRYFEEFGVVMSLMSVVPKTCYANGLHKMFNRTVKEDYFNRALQVIGEDEILNQELYVDHTDPDGVFGYQARYDEYRSGYFKNRISGEFHTTEKEWHAARIFASDPALNSSFITCNPTKRYLTDTTNHSLYCSIKNQIVARRAMISNPRPMIF